MPEMNFYVIKNKLIWEETQQNIKIQEKIPKLKEILASKLNKIAKTQFFGKPSHLTCRKKCEKKSLYYVVHIDSQIVITNYGS